MKQQDEQAPERAYIKLLSNGELAAYRADIRKEHRDGRPVYEYSLLQQQPTSERCGDVTVQLSGVQGEAVVGEVKATRNYDTDTWNNKVVHPSIIAERVRHGAQACPSCHRLLPGHDWVECQRACAAYLPVAETIVRDLARRGLLDPESASMEVVPVAEVLASHATPTDLAERARRVVDVIERDLRWLQQFGLNEAERERMATIIAAEFAGVGGQADS
jgi:hypothetical protein